MVLTLKVLWGDPSSASCGSTTFCSKGHRDFTERLHCPCQPRGNVLLLAKKQPRMASYVLWIDGILGQVLSAYKFTFSVLCSITSQLSATLIVIRFFSFQLSYHPIGMNTYIKTVNREYISLFFVVLEVNIKILFTSTKVSIWKQTYLLFFGTYKELSGLQIRWNLVSITSLVWIIWCLAKMSSPLPPTLQAVKVSALGQVIHTKSGIWYVSELYHFVMVDAKKEYFQNILNAIERRWERD